MALTMMTGTSIGPVYFDAVFKTTHQSNVTVTSQPVQTGASIADHAYLEPDTVSIEIGMTDAAVGAGENHSVNAHNMLRAVMEELQPISLYTRLKSYTDMLIVAMTVDDDYTTSTALRANIMLQKIVMVDVATVTVQKAVSSSKSSSQKKKETTEDNNKQEKESVLSKLLNKSKDSSESKTTTSTTKLTNVLKEGVVKAISGIGSLFKKS